jgi:ATP-dependent RNA helicase SUPV3L1/SUV3
MDKYDGTSLRPLTAPEVKQIAGRAGRYGSRYTFGEVTCINQVTENKPATCTVRPFVRVGPGFRTCLFWCLVKECTCDLRGVCKQEDMPRLHACLEAENPPLERACLFPRYHQLALFAEQHPDLSFANALEHFADRYHLNLTSLFTSGVVLCRRHKIVPV